MPNKKKPERCKNASTLRDYIATHHTLQNDEIYWSEDGKIRCNLCGPKSKPIPNCSKLPQHVTSRRHILRKEAYQKDKNLFRSATTIAPNTTTSQGHATMGAPPSTMRTGPTIQTVKASQNTTMAMPTQIPFMSRTAIAQQMIKPRAITTAEVPAMTTAMATSILCTNNTPNNNTNEESDKDKPISGENCFVVSEIEISKSKNNDNSELLSHYSNGTSLDQGSINTNPFPMEKKQ